MKILKKIIIVLILCVIAIWGFSITYCEILTHFHGKEFAAVYRENTMMGEIDYLKVLDYSDATARVYYVSRNRSGGDILVFVKKDGQWKYEKWEKTVWSKTGSADSFMWPYIR